MALQLRGYPYFTISGLHSEWHGLDILDVLFGKDEKHFRLHKVPICNKAPGLAKMFDGGLMKKGHEAVKLPDDEPGAFQIFVEWIMTDNLALRLVTTIASSVVGKRKVELLLLDYAKATQFAKKIALPDFM
jgi:hypothetical protein